MCTFVLNGTSTNGGWDGNNISFAICSCSISSVKCSESYRVCDKVMYVVDWNDIF
jgi:hypothetical protein